MATQSSVVPSTRVESRILTVRGQQVIVDADLAELYGVSTKALNQAVRRNTDRFPTDFVFKLSIEEKEEVVTKCDHLARLKFSKNLPYAFTEHGAIMAAGILNSELAVQTSIWIVRTFVKLRSMLIGHAELAAKINAMERKYDTQFKTVFDALRGLMRPTVSEPKERIGFVVRPKQPKGRARKR